MPLRPVSELGLVDVTDVAVERGEELPAPAASEAASQRTRRADPLGPAAPGRHEAPREKRATRVLRASGPVLTGGSPGARSAQRRSDQPSVRIYTSSRGSTGRSRPSAPRGPGGSSAARADRSRARARPADRASPQAHGVRSPRQAPRPEPVSDPAGRPAPPPPRRAPAGKAGAARPRPGSGEARRQRGQATPQPAGRGEQTVSDTLKGAALAAVAGVAGGLLLIRTVCRRGT
jgi:hypothetical protein